jgi:hypothetical protein
MTKKLYKILVDGKSCHGGTMKWSLPKKKGKKWTPGEWHEHVGEVKICATGFHLTTEPFKWYKWGCTAYEAEAEGIESWENDKCACKRVRLLKEVPHPKWWTDTCGWIDTLKNIAWLKPDGKPKKEWKLFETRDVAWDATRATARDAAGDAAGAAAWAATRDAAGDAAGDAAWAATRDAARDAAGAAAWAATRDAALYARGMIVDDLKLESKHRTHIKDRMEVWQKGYGLLCDVNGVLYVYEKL